ncbi:MAG TPA: Spy/CpxP family protein refolding chaperone [Caulobacteraceae bacterium]|nr:Spy/CpxP family protein refolding chaperone [Caulobacteraceae bacterium]
MRLRRLSFLAAAGLMAATPAQAAEPAPAPDFSTLPFEAFERLAGQMMPMVRQLGAGFETDPARRAEHLREMLQLRPDQESALQAFVSASSAQPRFDPAAHGGEESLTTPQRLERTRARMAEHHAAFERRADALTRFYGQLTPSQKKVFDKLPGADGMGAHPFQIMRMAGPGKGDRVRLRTPPPAPPES